eukprot:UN22698
MIVNSFLDSPFLVKTIMVTNLSHEVNSELSKFVNWRIFTFLRVGVATLLE